MRRIAPLAVLVLAGVVAPSALAAPLAVRAVFDLPTVQFGDALATHVVVTLDRRQVRPESVRIVDDLAPLTAVSAQRTTRTRLGNTLVIAVDRSASCIGDACIAAQGDATPALHRVTVTGTTRDGHAVRASAAWPALHVRGRVTQQRLLPAVEGLPGLRPPRF